MSIALAWDGSEHGQHDRAHHAGQARDEEQQLAAFRDHLAGVLEDVPMCARGSQLSRGNKCWMASAMADHGVRKRMAVADLTINVASHVCVGDETVTETSLRIVDDVPVGEQQKRDLAKRERSGIDKDAHPSCGFSHCGWV